MTPRQQIQTLLHAVEMETGYSEEQLAVKSREGDLVEIRRACFWIMTNFFSPPLSLQKAADVFGKDHATALSSCRRHEELTQTRDPKYVPLYEQIRAAYEREKQAGFANSGYAKMIAAAEDLEKHASDIRRAAEAMKR